MSIYKKLEENEAEVQRIKQLKSSINSLNKLNKQMEIFNILKENDVLATFFSKTAPEENFIEAIENISAVMEGCNKQFIATFIECFPGLFFKIEHRYKENAYQAFKFRSSRNIRSYIAGLLRGRASNYYDHKTGQICQENHAEVEDDSILILLQRRYFSEIVQIITSTFGQIKISLVYKFKQEEFLEHARKIYISSFPDDADISRIEFEKASGPAMKFGYLFSKAVFNAPNHKSILNRQEIFELLNSTAIKHTLLLSINLWKIVELAIQRYTSFKNIKQGYDNEELYNFLSNSLANRDEVISKYPSVLACIIRYGCQKGKGKTQHKNELVEYARETGIEQLYNDVTQKLEEIEKKLFH